MSVSLFVYYRVAAATEAAVRARVDALQTEVFAATGIRGRLLRRRDDPSTWMEVYEAVDDTAAFEQVLDAALARHGFAALLGPGEVRHSERFVPAGGT